MTRSRRLAALAAAAAVCVPLAACGQSDIDKAKNQVQDAADQVKGNLNDVSKKDLEKALNDAQAAAKNGSADTKKKAKELQRKIERELNSRK
jgi:DNA polymerase III delta prime subunit